MLILKKRGDLYAKNISNYIRSYRHRTCSIWNVYKSACYNALYAHRLIHYDLHHERRRKTETKGSKQYTLLLFWRIHFNRCYYHYFLSVTISFYLRSAKMHIRHLQLIIVFITLILCLYSLFTMNFQIFSPIIFFSLAYMAF